MKRNMINKYLAAGAFLLLGGLTACEDFLTVLPTGQITEEDFWQDKADLDNARAGAYKQATSTPVLEKVLVWGELRSDNLILNKMDNTSILYLQEGILRPTEGMFNWAELYKCINYCNKVLERGQLMVDNNVDATLREGDWNPIKAEMQALRALQYFYLVRAYRDVPFITTSISTDAEASVHRPAVTPGSQILETLINDLEPSLSYAAINFAGYGSQANYTRFTRRSIKALLADMYLWRGCMLKEIEAKGDTIVCANGDTLKTNEQANPIATECFTKAKQYSTEILTEMSIEYETEYLKRFNDSDEEVSIYQKSLHYPFFYFNERTQKDMNDVSGTDVVYANIFGQSGQYSKESILEWPNIDGAGSFNNSTYSNYLSSTSNNTLSAGTMTISNSLLSNKENVDKDGSFAGFTKTDARLLSTVYLEGSSQMVYPVLKHIAQNIYVENWADMNDGYPSKPSWRNTSSAFDATWPVYRMSDIALIKAEACARLNTDLKEGFRLTNALFIRNNPALESTVIENPVDDELISARLDTAGYANGKTAADLLALVYRERQREFVSEGKRWFDLVRYAEASYSKDKATKPMFDQMLNANSTLRNRCRRLPALYNPIYSEELKVNGSLEQNEVWDKYTK